MSRTRILLAIAACGLVLPSPAADWSYWRGPTQDGRSVEQGVFGASIGLERAWKADLGSAYSATVVADGKLITLFSDGTDDHLVALDVANGREFWRYRIGPKYRGHDGSDDGGLSTPVVDHGTVYGLGPKGKLFAVRLVDGVEVWAFDITERFSAKEPDYGFTTTPLVTGDVLIVQTGGGDGRSVSGIATEDGRTLWTALDFNVDYQSPTLMKLAGSPQVVVADTVNLAGLDPESGEVLWTHEHRGNGTGTPGISSLGGNRLLLKNWTGLVAYELKPAAGGGFELEKLYRTADFDRSYQPPILHEGYLYGFTSTFLTCADAATGERVWKSRPPGGSGMVLVDGHLVIFASKGRVVVAEATPKGYLEKASVRALEQSSLSWPSFSDGRVFVRNLEEIAAVAITDAPAVASTSAPDPFASSAFHRFLDGLGSVPDRQAAVDDLFAEQKRFPIVEGDRVVHFVHRGEFEDVAILGSMLDYQEAAAMQHVDGTDLYFNSFEIEPGVRIEYRFQENFEGDAVDPLNPDRVHDWWENRGEWSLLSMPGYASPTHLDPADEIKRGSLEQHAFSSRKLRNKRDVKVYLPAGYAEGDRDYPLLVVNDGLGWVEHGRMANTLDNLAGDSVAPIIVAFVGKPEDDWWNELGGKKTEEYSRMLVDELLPWLDERYRIRSEPSERAIMGTLAGGRAALHSAVNHPGVFGKVALRSISFEGDVADDAVKKLGGPDRPALEIYFDWNRYEWKSEANGYDRYADARRLEKLLKRAGFAFQGGEWADSYGWGSLGAHTDAMLQTLFPAR